MKKETKQQERQRYLRELFGRFAKREVYPTLHTLKVTFCEITEGTLTFGQAVRNLRKKGYTDKRKGAYQEDTRHRVALQKLKDGRVVAEYPSIYAAAKAHGGAQNSGLICVVVDKPNRSAFGYKWRSK